MERLLAFAARIGSDPADPPELRLRKLMITVFLLGFWPVPVVWGLIYLAFGEPAAAAIPFGYSVVAIASLLVFAATRAFGPFRAVNLALWIALPLLLQVVLGGFAASSAVVMWSVVAPFAALVLASGRTALWWLGVFLAELAVAGALDQGLPGRNALPAALVTAFFVLNIGALATVAVALMATFLSQKDLATRLLAAERERSESLLLNVLPREIAPRLKAGEKPIADAYEGATILFADIVGFTSLTQRLPPDQMVGLLDEIVSRFDVLADRRGVEKIRTAGDNYMAVAGVPVRRADHASAIARLALDMRGYVDELHARGEQRIEFRIGIQSGPCVGGVIGLRKFVFDIWGDSVNTAQRMEAHGVPGRIQVGEAAYLQLRDAFELEERGVIEVKGKGLLRTWFLVGERASPLPEPDNARAAAPTASAAPV